MPGIAVHHTEVDTQSEWDGGAEVGKLETPITGAVARGMFAWYDSQGVDDNNDDWPDNKGSYKLPHHLVNASGEPGAASLRGVNNAMARLSQTDIPQGDIADVRAHLEAHQADAKAQEERKRTAMNQKSNNPLLGLLKDVISVITNFAQKDRAVNIAAIWQTVQKSLETEAVDGDVMSMPSGFVLDVYMEEGGPFAIITKSDGKLYKVPVMVDADSKITLGVQQEVVMDFTPVTGRQVTIKRQADGKVRWFAMPACTAVLNRSGEIDSRALFDSFVEHIERTKKYPELDFFHLGRNLTLGVADWVGRDEFAYCASGTFYDTPIARAAIKTLEEKPDFWGLSIAYLPTGEPEKIRSNEGIEIPVYNAGINRFISLLPESTAASILTNISTSEVNRMNEKMKQALKVLTGDDEKLFTELSEKLDSVNRTASEPGVITREADAAPETRAITPDDITAIVGSDAFKTAVTDIVNGLLEAQANRAQEAAPAAATTTTPPPAATPASATVESEREVVDNSEMMELLKGLKETVDKLSTTREASVQEVLNDLPARITKQNIVRPRATRTPADSSNLANRRANLSEIANKTLQSMGEAAPA